MSNLVVQEEPVVLILPSMYKEQRELLMSGYRDPKIQYIVGAWGTKAGKSYGASILLTKFAWENPDTVSWWIAPTYQQAEEIGKKYITKLLPKGFWKESEKGKKITILNADKSERSEIWFKSADDEDNLRGFRVHLIIADEMARISEVAYESFRTTVTKTRGKIIFLSTPKGHNLFYDFFQRGDKSRLGKDEVDPFPDWFSMKLPTIVNPFPTPEETAETVADAERNLPYQTFRQEYLAEFLSNASTVFGTYRDCIQGEWFGKGTGPGSSRYGVGLDLGRSHDYTVLTVMDLHQRRVVDFERFNQIDWQLQYAKITAMCRKYNNAILIMDATSAGDPIFNTLMMAGLNVIPYRIYTNTAKRELIDNLRVHIEQRKITYPNIPELMRELEDYEINITPTGVITYSAPRGRHKHDDCVISLALVTMLVNQPEHHYIYSNERGV